MSEPEPTIENPNVYRTIEISTEVVGTHFKYTVVGDCDLDGELLKAIDAVKIVRGGLNAIDA